MKKLSLIIIFVFSVILINAQETDPDQILIQDPNTEEASNVSPDEIGSIQPITDNEYSVTVLNDTVLKKPKKVRDKTKRSHYLTLGAGLGPTGFNYDLKGINSDGTNSLRLGGNAILGYSFFFNKNWGIGTGLGASYYRTYGKYNGDFSGSEYYSLGSLIDDDGISGNSGDFELRVRLANWREEQTALFFEIPVLLQFQHKFGRTQRSGIYFSLGAKFQIPVKSEYKVLDGDYTSDKKLNVSGYYSDSGIDFGAPGDADLSYHGFGSIHNPNAQLGWNGDIDLKMSIAGTAELGFIFGLSPRIDLTLGGFIDYGFNNIKKGNSKEFMTAPEQYHPDANGNVGKGIVYNGMVNSDRIEKTNLFSYGAKVGIRIRLGKKENIKEYDLYNEAGAPIVVVKDTCCGNDNKNIERLLEELLDKMSQDTKEPVVTLRGVVRDTTDSENIKVLKNAKVTVYNEALVIGNLLSSSIDGSFNFNLQRNQNYRIHAEYDDEYFSNSVSFSTNNFTKDTIIDVEIDLYQIPMIISLPNIEYDYGKADLRPESTTSLDDLIKTLTDNPRITIELRSHTDYRGTEDFNMDLSFQRAKACIDYLVDGGIDPERLDAKGLGEGDPKVIDEKTAKKYPFFAVGDVLTEEYILKLTPRQQEVANQLNRRTEFSVLSKNYVPR